MVSTATVTMSPFSGRVNGRDGVDGIVWPPHRCHVADMKPNPLLSEQLCFVTHAVDQAFQQIYRPLLTDLGLTYPQFLVLMVLWEVDDRTVGELGEALHLQSNTLTPVLKRMAQAEFVTRQRDARDERTVRIRLTQKGRDISLKAPDILNCAFIAAGQSMEQLKELTQALQVLNANLRRKDPVS